MRTKSKMRRRWMRELPPFIVAVVLGILLTGVAVFFLNGSIKRQDYMEDKNVERQASEATEEQEADW